MQSRAEITIRYAKAYAKASKGERGRMLDEVVAVTGWNRDNARRRLVEAGKTSAASKGKRVAPRPRKPRARKYSYVAVKVLQRVWVASGGQCGKYLAPARARDPLHGMATTKASTLLRSSITIRKAGDDVETEPGFFEGDTVAHCGPVAKGEFARTLNLTDVRIGWTFTRSMRNNAHVHVVDALQRAEAAIPYAIIGLDFDNGGEFMNHAVTGWATDSTGRRKRIYDTPATPFDRLLAARVLSPARIAELTAYRDQRNPAAISRRITEIQHALTTLARDATIAMQTALTTPLPPATTGVRLKTAG